MPFFVTEEIQSELVEVFEWLHRHPELSNREYMSTAYLIEKLERHSIRVLDSSLDTGLIAEVGNEGPIVALRADIDALPIEEETGLEYSSEHEGVMHACGHDFHAASLFGAGLLLKANEGSIPGRVRLVFQPAEEYAEGAEAVMATGLLDEAKAIFGIHSSWSAVGKISVRGGAINAAVDNLEIIITGVGGHAAHPENLIDTVSVASLLVNALQTIASRNVNPTDSIVLSMTSFHSGGKAVNVFEPSTRLKGTLRTFSETARALVMQRVAEIAKGFEIAFNVNIDIEWDYGTGCVNNDAALCAMLNRELKDANVYELYTRNISMGSEDFSVYQKYMPGVMALVGTGGDAGGHTPSFTVDKGALPIAASLYADMALLSLQNLP
ncbi:MAG: amidohydrolase [Eubacteriaceae bacterium]|jgi:amidohydrolase|nr:amidohydrolase [Eubacteriaceae bacterium]